MKNRSRLLHATLLVTVLALVPLFVGARPRPAGAVPYTPSRIEWACVYLNALAHAELSESSRYGVDYSFKGTDPDTVIVKVSHFADFDHDRLKQVIDNARELPLLFARTRGWNWMVVKVEISVFDPNPREPTPTPTAKQTPAADRGE